MRKREREKKKKGSNLAVILSRVILSFAFISRQPSCDYGLLSNRVINSKFRRKNGRWTLYPVARTLKKIVYYRGVIRFFNHLIPRISYSLAIFFSLLSTLCIVKMSYALPSEFPPNRNASLPTCGEFLIKKKNLLPTTIDPPAVIFSSKAKTWLTELRSFNSTRKRRSWTRSGARVWESQWLSDSRRGNKENFSETRRSNSARNARKERNDEKKELSKLPEGKGGW